MPHAWIGLAAAAALTTSGLVVPSDGTASSPTSTVARCHAGARTAARPGSVLYPEVGNGGYRTEHSAITLRYDAPHNRFLDGTHVVHRMHARSCLTELSLDFEPRAALDFPGGPRMRVQRVLVDGHSVSWRLAQPTYPGDPVGTDDPDPRAHQASQNDPVGGPAGNPLPPACSPEIRGGAPLHSRDGTPCPATKLVITPGTPIPAGSTFRLRVDYVGHPGTHRDGSGSEDGWYRTRGGSATYTEPVGTEDWLPLDNVPRDKPTYDLRVTTQRGKTVIGNGQLSSDRRRGADAQFPHGSHTVHWHDPYPTASYLVLAMAGDYSLHRRQVAGMTFYTGQDRHLGRHRRALNARQLRKAPKAVRFEGRWNGGFPFGSLGGIAAIPGSGGSTEEMQTMVTYAARVVDAGTLYHEIMHQWWGDNVSERDISMTFFKEGLATLAEILRRARDARQFDRHLVREFDDTYANAGRFWVQAPHRPRSYSVFSDNATYNRPGAAYVALLRILGHHRFVGVLRHLQQRYGGSTLGFGQLESAFRHGLPRRTAGCSARLHAFFHQWFEVAYPRGGGVHRPRITGPGLHGHDFYGRQCPAPAR